MRNKLFLFLALTPLISGHLKAHEEATLPAQEKGQIALLPRSTGFKLGSFDPYGLDNAPQKEVAQVVPGSEVASPEETPATTAPNASSMPPLIELPATPEATPQTTSQPAKSQAEEQSYAIQFRNVSMVEFVRFVSKIAKVNIVFDEADLQFPVTIVAKEPMKAAEVVGTMVQILRLHNLSLADQGSSMLIYKNAQLATLSEVVSQELGNVSTQPPTVVTRVFRLENTLPSKVAPAIASMLSPQAQVEVADESHHLVVTDATSNVDRVAKLLESLDTPNLSLEIGFYEAQYVYIETLIALAQKIMNPIVGSAPFVMVPQTTIGAIYVVSSPYIVERTLSVLRSLDIQKGIDPNTGKPLAMAGDFVDGTRPGLSPSSPMSHESHDNTSFFIYKLQYHRGDKIESSLQNISTGLSKGGDANQGLVSAISSMQWIETSNSLLFTGSPNALNKIKDLVKSLDIPLRQVFIEVLIIETSLSNSLNFGVEWGLQENATLGNAHVTPTAGLFQSGSTQSTIFNVPKSSQAAGNPPTGLGMAQGFNLGVLGNLISRNGTVYGSLSALVQALQTDTTTRILMNPKIITEDNKQALVFVGQSIPISVSTTNVQASIQQTTASVEYRDIGTKLDVRPILGSSDMVTLEISQEITSVSSGLGTATPTFSKANTTTRVHVPDREFLVISGMIDEQKTNTKSGIPCLGTLPAVGSAFGTQSDSVEKNNILIFIRPYIVSTPEEIAELSRGQTLELQKSDNNDSDIRDAYQEVYDSVDKAIKKAKEDNNRPAVVIPAPAPLSSI